MSASGTGPRKTKFEPQMAGFVKVFTPNHYRDDFDSWDQCNRFAARAFASGVSARSNAAFNSSAVGAAILIPQCLLHFRIIQ